MLAALVAAALTCPQDQPRPATSPLGWPVDRRPAAGAPATQDTRGLAPQPGGLPAQGRAESLSPHSAGANEAALLPVFRAVGTPADAAALGGVRLRVRITVYDHRGAELAEREVVHEADLGSPERDRLLRSGDTVYGRDGATVFAHYRGIAFPNLESEARAELAWFGRVLRMPWLFADPAAYVVHAREEMLLSGRPMSRHRITARAAHSGDLAPPVEVCELWCDPDTSEPRVLVLEPVDPGARPCRIRLLEFQSFGNVRIPMRRSVEGPEGNKVLELEVVELTPRQSFPRRSFAPPAR